MIGLVVALLLSVAVAVAVSFKVDGYGTLEFKPRALSLLVFIVTFAVTSLISGVVFVNAGSVGVVTQFGAVTGTNFEQGMHFKIPFIQGVDTFDVRTQKEQVEAAAASADLQTVHSVVAVNYHLDAKQVSSVFREIGTKYKERVLDPAVQESFKYTTAQFTAEQLITKREEVKSKALEHLKQRMATFHIIVDEFNIVNFDFSPEFNAAIEAKQVAQQNVEKAKQDLARIEVEAKQKVAEANGTAQSQALLRPNLTPEYLQYLAINKWDGKLPTATNGVPFLQLPIQK